MDVSTKEEWLNIGAETAKNQPRVAEGILKMLSEMHTIVDGFVTDQLTHALQTATLAERAGADEHAEHHRADHCEEVGQEARQANPGHLLERQLDAARHGEQHAYTLSSAAEPLDCSATSPMHEAWLDAQIWKAQFRCRASS